MVDFIEKIYFKYKEFWWHLLFGILIAGVNIGLYFIFKTLFIDDNVKFYSAWILASCIAVIIFAILENSKLIDFVDKMYFKYKEIFWYLVFGVLTTIVNIAVYFILGFIFGNQGVLYLIWNAIAWVVAVIFAYITNKKYVFESVTSDFESIMKEITAFVGCRLFSGVLDMLFMYFTVSIMLWNDGIMKILSNFIVVVLNYVFSKLLIFKNK